jgi:hypothetical protein
MTSNPSTIMNRTIKQIGFIIYFVLCILDIFLLVRFVCLLLWSDKQPPQDKIWFCGSVLSGISSLLVIRGIEMYASSREQMGATNQGEENLTGVCEEQKEQRERLWRHGLNEDKNFNDRLTFFLLFQSFLIGGVLNFYKGMFLAPSGGYQETAVMYGVRLTLAISFIGILICIIWMYVQVRQGFQLKILTKRMRECAPEYRETVRVRNVGVFKCLHATMLLSYCVPGLVIALWCAIIYYTPPLP